MTFDFFYGSQSESFSFYRIPRMLITDPAFRCLSADAKLLYGLLLDRMGLSARSGWYQMLKSASDSWIYWNPSSSYISNVPTTVISVPSSG